MTRGQIAIITPDGRLITSTEFNGDMNYSEHGQDVFDTLETVESEAEYREFVEEFNRQNFENDGELFFECDDSFYDMSTDYFGKWFSDYVYIKNLSDKDVVFTDADKQKIVLEPDATMAFNFGKFYASGAEDFEKREFIEQLGVLKNGLGYDMQENYANLWNACAARILPTVFKSMTLWMMRCSIISLWNNLKTDCPACAVLSGIHTMPAFIGSTDTAISPTSIIPTLNI